MATENTRWNSYYDPYESAIQELEASLRGRLVRPGQEGYDEARLIWQGSVDHHPELIVQAADAADVVRAVRCARELDLTVAVRSGGHSMAGHGMAGTMVIDLSHMKAMTVDPERRVARVESGRTWGEYAEEAGKYGLATSSGDMASVGIGGLTLGGGIGWMVRKYGLTIDHLRSVEVVTADGHLLKASRDENPDLFWAVRGGGGNFGIATSFELDLKPVPLIVGGATIYDAADGEQILTAWRDYSVQAPEELTTMAMIMAAPPAPFIPPEMVGRNIIFIMVCYAGDVDEGMRVVQPLRTLGTPVADLVGPMPYTAMFELTKMGTVKGLGHHDRSMYLSQLDDTALKTILLHTCISPLGGLTQIRLLGGAMSRVPEDDSAFAHRDKKVLVNILTSWEDPAQTEDFHAWVDAYWSAMRPLAHGVYVNFLSDEGEARIREAYKPATYARLVELKNKYDPSNFFRLNQNIKPTAGRARNDRPAEEQAA